MAAELQRLAGGFLTKAFVHFVWIGMAKWALLMGGLILTVDMLGMSGWAASLVITPTITAINWVAIQYFLLAADSPGSE